MPDESTRRDICLLSGAFGLYTLAFTAPVAGAVTFYELSSGYVHAGYPWWVTVTAFLVLVPALLSSLAYLGIGRRDGSKLAYAAGIFILLASLAFMASASGTIEQNLFVVSTHTPDYSTPYYYGYKTNYFVVDRFEVNVGSYWIFECVLAVGAVLMGVSHYAPGGRKTGDGLSRRTGLVQFAAAALLSTFLLSFLGFVLLGAGAFMAAAVVRRRPGP